MPSDSDYLEAVNSGDTATAQRMVDEAAEANGYTVGPVYHRTSAKNITEFRPWVNFGTEEQATNVDLTGRGEGDTRTYRAFLNVSNPIRVQDEGMAASNVLQQAREQGVVSGGEMAGFPYNKGDDVERAYVAKVLEKNGFDGIVYENEYEGKGDSYIALKPSQIKLADPITKDDSGNVIPLSQRFKATSEDIRFMPDYSGEHRAPQRDSGAPLDNLKDVYPDDVYGPKGALYYGHASGDATDKAAIRIIQSARNKPDAPVKVFRAIPKGIQSNEINPGDWITTIKSYAVQHGEGALGGDYKILEKTVPAGDLYTNGDSIFEFGYDPKFMPSPDSAMPGAYSFPGGYRALPGKAKGSLRLYGPAGSLLGIAASLDEAQRIIRKKSKQ